MQSKQFHEAVELYRSALELDPDNAEYKIRLDEAELRAKVQNLRTQGEELMEQHDLDAAYRCFVEALQLAPNNVAVQQDKAAAARLQQAQELQQAGEEHLANGNYADAVTLLHKSLQLDPDNKTVSGEEADAQRLKSAGEYKKAGIQAMENHIREDQSQGRQDRGKDQGKDRRVLPHDVVHGDYTLAIQNFEKATNLNPDDQETQEMLAQARRMKRALDKARIGDHEELSGDLPGALLTYTVALSFLKLPDDDTLAKYLRTQVDATKVAIAAQETKESEARVNALRKQGCQQCTDLRKRAETAMLAKDYETASLLLAEALVLANEHQPELAHDIEALRSTSAAGQAAAAKVAELQHQAEVKISLEQWEEAVQLSEQAVKESAWHLRLPVSTLLTHHDNASSALEAAAAAQRAAAHAGELGRRLKAAGAMVGKLTCSLMWDDNDDLDLHCETPSGEHIFWNHKRSKCGGHLDVDMNASDKHLTTEGCENIYWQDPQIGHYKFWVENNQERDDQPTPFTVRLSKNGQVEEKTFADLEEYDEEVCFEFDLDSTVDLQQAAAAETLKLKLVAEASKFAEDAAALEDGMHTFRLTDATVTDAQERCSAAKRNREVAKQVAVLQRQGEAQYKSEDFTAAEVAFQRAIALAKEHGIDTSRLGPQSQSDADIKTQAQRLVLEGRGYFEKEDYKTAYRKFSEALEVCPTSGQARDWKREALAQIDTTNATAVDHNDASAVAKSAEETVDNMWLELDLSEAGTLNYRRFISWWQLKMSHHTRDHKISDEELQTTMEIWHEFDEEGAGVTREGASGVLTGMLKAGVIRMTTDGHVLPANHRPQRVRGHTGMENVHVQVTERRFESGTIAAISETATTMSSHLESTTIMPGSGALDRRPRP